jgi:hypothetical protein
MIDAVGEEGNVVAPECESPCDFKNFMKALTEDRRGPPLKEADGRRNRKGANGKTLFQSYPDYNKDFTVFTDELFSDPKAAAKEIDKVHFTGKFKTESQFKGAEKFKDIISSVTGAIKKSQAALVAAGRDPKGGWFEEIKSLVSIAANARRYNRAIHLTAEFKAWFKKIPGLEFGDVVMAEPIHRAPFSYQKVDLHATYDANRAVVGIEEWQYKIKTFAVIQNAKGGGLGHVICIQALEKLEERLKCK